MKLWYQSLTRPDAWPEYQAALLRVLARAADPGTQVDVHGIEQRGGVGDQYRRLEFIETIEVLDNVARAEAEGYDAVLLGNIADPGLRTAREMATIPVVGLCETSLFTACQMGVSVGLVVSNDKHFSRVQENVALYGMTTRVVAVERMAVDRLVDLDEAFREGAVRDRILGQFHAAAEACVARGAEVVIPAVGVAMVLLAEAGIHETVKDTPVLCGPMALVQAGQAAVKLHGLMGGRFASRRGAYAQPPAGQIEELRRYYGPVYPKVRPG
ncbi:aspartate/glutamate racemase family protein [Falsiroseomonas sp. CW058]|uniref:aspartate/glutamate racemase family protein n=1 Tax=Falsiroseomonas sp. CW058 TaxID=3388664 RepID=UPI003D31582E